MLTPMTMTMVMMMIMMMLILMMMMMMMLKRYSQEDFLQFITFIDAQRLNCLSFMDKVGFTCFPERITPIFKFFNRNQSNHTIPRDIM